jgi:hypothetical protein
MRQRWLHADRDRGGGHGDSANSSTNCSANISTSFDFVVANLGANGEQRDVL